MLLGYLGYARRTHKCTRNGWVGAGMWWVQDSEKYGSMKGAKKSVSLFVYDLFLRLEEGATQQVITLLVLYTKSNSKRRLELLLLLNILYILLYIFY